MENYSRNRSCSCLRCKTRGVTTAVVLIMLGILLLMGTTGMLSIWKTWPLLLIAGGLAKIANRTTSTAGHIQSFGAQPPASPANTQVQS